jgi:monofunctional glycosyltransferase
MRPLRWLAWLVLLLVTAVFAVQLWFFGWVLWWRNNNPQSTAFMRAQLEQLQTKDPAARLKHQWVGYENISPHLKLAVIAAEDANFTDHDGVDWDAIERAYEKNLKKGKVVRGGSTITMQLAKNLFLSGSRSYVRKAQELVITYMIEFAMPKERILEIYLNVAEWGVGVFGCKAAAQHYFASDVARIGPSQSARLAAMLPQPRFYDRNRAAPGLARRAALIQRGMGSVDAP